MERKSDFWSIAGQGVSKANRRTFYAEAHRLCNSGVFDFRLRCYAVSSGIFC